MRILFLLFILVVMCISQEIPELKLSLARSGLYATSLEKYNLVFFAGGFSGNTLENFNIIDVLNITNFSWSILELSLARANIGITSVNNQGLVFFAGGRYWIGNINSLDVKIQVTNIVDIYDVKTKMFKIAYLSVNRSSISATSLEKEGLVFFAGGDTQLILNGNFIYTDNTDIIDIYDINKDIWSTALLSYASSNMLAISFNTLGLMIFGGDFKRTLDIYNSSSKNWTQFYLTIDRFEITACSLDKFGLIFIAGGMKSNNEKNTYLNQVEIIDIEKKNVIEYSLSVKRILFSSSALNDYGLVFFGGGLGYSGYSNVVDIYDANIKKWSVSYLSEPKISLTSISIKNIVIFAGGQNIQSDTNSIDIFGNCKGYITTKNPDICLPCPEGYYCNHQIYPIICPPGNYCPINSILPTKCPAGTYNEKSGSYIIKDCEQCPDGTYSSYLGIDSISKCIDCLTGSYCSKKSIESSPCPVNHYCPDSKTKIKCPVGTFSDNLYNTKSEDCQKCLTGYYCEAGKSPVLCEPGTYADKVGSLKCEDCPAGSACPMGSINPVICDVNSVAKKGSSACTLCSAGSYTEVSGSSDCIPCAGSQFDVSGWWCMSFFNKILFLGVWIGTALSGCATLKKIYILLRERVNLLREKDHEITVKNLFLAKKLESKKEISLEVEDQNLDRKFASNQKNEEVEIKFNQKKDEIIVPRQEDFDKKGDEMIEISVKIVLPEIIIEEI